LGAQRTTDPVRRSSYTGGQTGSTGRIRSNDRRLEPAGEPVKPTRFYVYEGRRGTTTLTGLATTSEPGGWRVRVPNRFNRQGSAVPADLEGFPWQTGLTVFGDGRHCSTGDRYGSSLALPLRPIDSGRMDWEFPLKLLFSSSTTTRYPVNRKWFWSTAVRYN
jgi:hypothetical protein